MVFDDEIPFKITNDFNGNAHHKIVKNLAGSWIFILYVF